MRKVTITRNTIVSSQQGAPQETEPSQDGKQDGDGIEGVSVQVGQTSEPTPVVVSVTVSEPEATDNTTDANAEATPEVVSHSTVEVTSSELQEGDERNSVHVQEEKVQKSETLESKSEEGNLIVENKQEVKEVVTIRKIVTKETVPIEWPKTQDGQSEEPESSPVEDGETPTTTEVEVTIEVESAPAEESTPGAEAAEEKLPEGDKDKEEPEDKDKTDDEHVDDGKSDLTSEEGTLERGSKSKDGKLSPSKRILAFFKRKSHKSKKKEAASDQEDAEKGEGDEAPTETSPTEDPEVQEEQISAVEAKRDNTVPSFPAEPETSPDSPAEEPSSPDDSLMKEPTPCDSSSPRKDDVSGGSPLESPSSCEHQEIILTADNPKSFTMADEKPSKPKKTATSPGFFARASQLLAPLHSPNSPNESFDSAITRSSRSSMDSGTSSDPNRHTGHFVVVAIDFGTTFSGYAFSFTRDPESIHMMRKWEGGDPGVINQKTPTCLLLTPDGEFKAFGFTARDLYHDLDPVEAEQWLYFEKFKMVLHYSAVSRMLILFVVIIKEFASAI